MQNRFEELSSSPLFKSLVSLLDVSFWRKELSDFGSAEIESLKAHFSQLLSNSGCDIVEIQREWMTLKMYAIPIQNNSPKVKYLEIWECVFSNENIEECKNVLYTIEILLITPCSNAKLERMLTRMLRVKNDWHNRLSCDRLSATLMICEEGPGTEKFNLDVAVSEWYDAKVRRLTSGPDNYPNKRKTSAEKSCVVDLAAMTLSDLKDLDSDKEQ